MKYPHVAITAPMCNRLWALPWYLGCIRDLDYPKKSISLIFIDDATTDGTRQMLDAFAAAHADQYRNIIILDGNDPLGDNATSARDTSDKANGYTHLAKLRNQALDEAIRVKTDYQLSVDNDILVSPGLLSGLMAHNLPYASSLIFNDGNIAFGVPSLLNRSSNSGSLDRSGKWTVFRRYKLNKLYPCGYTGAVYLVDSTVLKSGARFGGENPDPSHVCEDYAYCWALQQANIDRNIDTTLRTVHIMEQGLLNEGIGVYYAWFGHMPGKVELAE